LKTINSLQLCQDRELSNLKHESKSWLAFWLVAELVDEDAAKVQTARVTVSLVMVDNLQLHTHTRTLSRKREHEWYWWSTTWPDNTIPYSTAA